MHLLEKDRASFETESDVPFPKYDIVGFHRVTGISRARDQHGYNVYEVERDIGNLLPISRRLF